MKTLIIIMIVLTGTVQAAQMTIDYSPTKGYVELHDPNTAPILVIVIPLNENQAFALQQEDYKQNLTSIIKMSLTNLVDRWRKRLSKAWNLKDLKK